MKNGFSSGRGFQFSPSASSEISPPRDSAAFSNAPPTIHRPTATPLRLDSPLARVQTKRRCAYALHSPFPLDFSTRFLLRFPLETRSLPATCNLCKSFFLTIRISLSSLFISLIFIFNRHPRWPLHSYRSIFLVRTDGVFLLSFHWWKEVSRDGGEKRSFPSIISYIHFTRFVDDLDTTEQRKNYNLKMVKIIFIHELTSGQLLRYNINHEITFINETIVANHNSLGVL